MNSSNSTMISEPDFLESAREFLSSRMTGDTAEIAPTTELIDSGLMDSLLILEFFLFLEDLRGSSIDPEGFDVASLATLRDAYQLVAN